MISRDEVLNGFSKSGGTDSSYLEAHLSRFLNTYHRFDSAWDHNKGVNLLDIGAHWLHQAAVFSLGGYKVIAPGGKIIVTTPNFYRAGGRAWDWKRFLMGFGRGISTLEVLSTHTMGHHWKEYSLRELQHYFCLLSPDFDCVKGEYTNDKELKDMTFLDRFKWLRQGIYLEVEVAKKSNGITIIPGW